jgi:hypothetical protein
MPSKVPIIDLSDVPEYPATSDSEATVQSEAAVTAVVATEAVET